MEKLSEETLAGILRTLRLEEETEERRHSPRVGLRTQVDIEFPRDATHDIPPFTAWLRDISAEGIGFVTNQQLPLGTQLIVIFGHDYPELKRVLYSVAHCKMLFKGLYNVGARVEKTFDL